MPITLLDEGAAGESQNSDCRLSPPGAVPASPAIIVERPAPGIEIALADGRRVRFDRDVDLETIQRVIATLEGDAP